MLSRLCKLKNLRRSIFSRSLYAVKLGPNFMSTRTPALKFPLPPKKKEYQKRNTIVLDVDETLVCTLLHENKTVLRPHLIPFLRRAAEMFEVVVFSAGIHGYVSGILSAVEHTGYALDGKQVLGNNVILMARESMPIYTKHLAWLQRPFESVFHLDDTEHVFGNNPRHAILIDRFIIKSTGDSKSEGSFIAHHKQSSSSQHYGVSSDHFQVYHGNHPSDQDDTLLKLMPLLEKLHVSSNVVQELDYWRPAAGSLRVTKERNAKPYELKPQNQISAWTSEPPKGPSWF